MGGFIAALTFLTRLPVPGGGQPGPDDFKRAARHFPLIGLLLGFISVGLFKLLQPFLSGSLALMIVLGVGLVLTGAFHEDGFADVADACGGATRERRLEIMKDPRLGAFGAIALIFLLGFKFFGLQSLYIISNKNLLAALLIGPAWGRWIFMPLMAVVPPPPGHAGLGKSFTAPPWWWIVLTGLILAAITFKVLPYKTAPVMIAVIGAGIGQGWFYYRRLGGMTGDCFGAASQWVELSILLAVNWGLA